MTKIWASLVALSLSLASVAHAQPAEMPADYKGVLDTLGKQGDFKDGVLKVNIPRGDLKVVVDGIATPTPFGFGGWISMTKGTGGMEVMMGDLVLTEDQVSPVVTALLDNGLEATALHNHFFRETPRIFYLHVHGHGTAADLATRVKPAIALVVKAASAASPAAAAGRPLDGTLDTAALSKTIGYPGDQSGAVYKITIGRADLEIQEMGARITARMGLNTWAAFYGNDAEAVVAGDVAMLASEVTPVVKALRANGLDVVAMHHHMLGTQPTVIFLHYWGKGPASQLALGVRAALDHIGPPRAGK